MLINPTSFIPILKIANEFSSPQWPHHHTLLSECNHLYSQNLRACCVSLSLDVFSPDSHLLPPHLMLTFAQKVLSPGTVSWGLSFKEHLCHSLRYRFTPKLVHFPLCSLLLDISHSAFLLGVVLVLLHIQMPNSIP